MKPTSPSKTGQAVRIIVTAPGGDLAQKVAHLKRRGMRVDSVLDAIGVVTGKIPEGKLAALQATPGIKVERELAPPDAAVQ